MTQDPPLDCHPASEAERIQAFQNVFDVWRHAETLDEHLARRLASPQHQYANWFVGCLGERVVAALGSYPLSFHMGGERMEGFAIGSVHTVPDCRGRGYAPRLLEWVEDDQRKQSRMLGVLFSDIPIDYYARLGYVTCPACEGWLDLETLNSIPHSSLKLVDFDPRSEFSSLAETYTRWHADLPLAIARDADYWNYLLRKGTGNVYSWVMDQDNKPQGYVCLKPAGESLHIEDFAVPEHLETAMTSAIFKEAQARGFRRVGGWLPDAPAFAKVFPLTPRQTEQTMLKLLDRQRKLDPEMRQAAGRIHEIDHV